MKEWLKPLGYKFPFAGNKDTDNWTEEQKEASRLSINNITNEILLKWLDEFIEPEKWIIEITGGEPGLYPEINTLISALNEKGYRGLIKTNGTLPIPKSENFKLVTAWHESVENIPPYYDWILLIKNPLGNWREKAEYCKKQNIPYKALAFNRRYKTGVDPQGLVTRKNSFLFYSVIMSMGQIMPCPNNVPTDGVSIHNMSPPLVKDLRSSCYWCGSIAGVEIFLPKNIIEKAKKDLEIMCY
jgi:hypothetical protein